MPLNIPKPVAQRLVARIRREKGYEITPDGLEEVIQNGIDKFRQGMIDRGHAEFVTLTEEAVCEILLTQAMREVKEEGA